MKHFYWLIALATLFACGKKEGLKPSPKPEPTKPDTENTDPTITGFSPEITESGQPITITGTNFGTDVNAVKVKFADGDDTTPDKITATHIEIKVPENAKTGIITVSVGSKPKVKTNKEFMVVVPDPEITSFTPDNGTIGDVIVIKGSGFGNDKSKVTVKAGTGEPNEVVSVSPTEISFALQSGTTGKLTVKVGDKSVESEGSFKVNEGKDGDSGDNPDGKGDGNGGNNNGENNGSAWTTTTHFIVAEAGNFTFDKEHKNVLKVDFSNLNGGGILTKPTGNIAVELVNAQKGTMTVKDYSGEKRIYFSNINIGNSLQPLRADTLDKIFVRFTEKDPVEKKSTQYIIFMQDTGMTDAASIGLLSQTPFAENLTVEMVENFCRTSDQRILEVKVK